MTQIIFNSQEEFEDAVMDVIDYNVIQKECSKYFDDSTTYADELATSIFNKLTEHCRTVR